MTMELASDVGKIRKGLSTEGQPAQRIVTVMKDEASQWDPAVLLLLNAMNERGEDTQKTPSVVVGKY